MNIQAINMKSTKRRRNAAGKATVAGKIYIVAGVLLVFGVVSLVLNYRTWLNKKIANIDKQTVHYRQKIHQLDREIEDLRIRKESLSNWTHIQSRIGFLNLELRLPAPSQVQRLVINLDKSPIRKRTESSSGRKVAMNSYNQ
jgi:hypothetical protein